MNIWLITIGEPLPIDGGNQRLLRTGILANLLVDKGYNVVWWTSTFNHMQKEHRFEIDTSVDIDGHYKIKLLYAMGYKKNISICRIINHYWIARKFSKLTELEDQPDIILCSFPPIDLSLAATTFGKKKGIPVVLDVRDLWPDIFVDIVPNNIRWLARALLYRMFKYTREAFRECTSIVGVSDGYLRWGLSYASRLQSTNDAVFPFGYLKPIITKSNIEIAEASLRKVGIDSSKKICWFVGMFGKTYDLHTIIDAAQQLERQGVQNVQFVLSGDGDNYTRCVKHAEGLRNVVFTGWINSTQITYLMRIADIGLAAYAKRAPQGLPNKIFEYLSAGIPVLSSLTGETEALLSSNKCGLTYVAGEVKSFLDALFILTNDEALRKKMGLNGLSLFETNFSAERVYSKMVDFLVGLARGHSQTTYTQRLN